MNVAQESLDFRRRRFSRLLTLLMPAFSLHSGPDALSVILHPGTNAPLPLSMRTVRSFGSMLEPRYIFGADTLDQ